MSERVCLVCKSTVQRGLKSIRKCRGCERVFHTACLNGAWTWNFALYRCALCCKLRSPFASISFNAPLSGTCSVSAVPVAVPASECDQLPVTPTTSILNKQLSRKRLLSPCSLPSPSQQQPSKVLCSLLDSHASSRMSLNDMPAWFKVWNDTIFKETMDRNLEALTNRVNVLEDKVEHMNCELREIREELKATRAVTEIRERENLLSDPCELRVSGIPAQFSDNFPQAIERIFEVTNCINYLNFVVSIRKWSPSSSRTNAGTVEKRDSFALVISLPSPIIRNKIASQARLLRDKTCLSIFGVGGENKVFITPLWPRQVYELLRAANRKYKDLGYLRPTVRNLTVYMRTDNQSPLITIRSLQDLDKLAPRTQPQ